MTGKVFISYGLGGAAVETWSNGLRLLVQRCKAIGLDTAGSPYNWNDLGPIISEINRTPSAVPIAIGGASFGDDEAPDIASRIVRRPVKYLFGFQCSIYGVDVGVPSNVEFADNIYNPSWLETFGLGFRRWHLAAGNKVTKLNNIPVRASHPGDWGIGQDIIFSRLHKHLVGPL